MLKLSFWQEGSKEGDRIMSPQITKIATHVRPHLDEIVAIWLLIMFGAKKYPGVAEAIIEYWADGGETPDGQAASEYEANGYLLVGTGGGRFDEHGRNGDAGKNGDCAATLVAKDLGIDQDSTLAKILKFTLTNDLRGASHPFDLSAIIKAMYQANPEDPEKVIAWAIEALTAKYLEQKAFVEAQTTELEKAEVLTIMVGAKEATLVVIESDNELVSKAARSKDGLDAAIVVQKCSSGNVQIYVNKRHGLQLFDLAQMLRLEEQHLKGNIVTRDWKVLSAEGKVDGAEEWYFHHEGQMLLNGSLSAPDVSPTQISLERIKQAITIAVNSRCLPEHCADSRQCTFRDCSWYGLGLHRCRKIRYEMNQAKQSEA